MIKALPSPELFLHRRAWAGSDEPLDCGDKIGQLDTISLIVGYTPRSIDNCVLDIPPTNSLNLCEFLGGNIASPWQFRNEVFFPNPLTTNLIGQLKAGVAHARLEGPVICLNEVRREDHDSFTTTQAYQ